MHKTFVLPGLAVVIGSVLACGDEDKKGGGGGSTPADCPIGLSSSSGSGGCSEAQIKEYSDCLATACQSQYQSCFGPDYLDGEFSGPCASYGECLGGCDCEDGACRRACQLTAECTPCVGSFATCGLSCASKLSCTSDGGPGVPDAGATKTCADLLACCGTLTDATRKQQCMMSHSQLSMLGLAGGCNSAYNGFCGN